MRVELTPQEKTDLQMSVITRIERVIEMISIVDNNGMYVKELERLKKLDSKIMLCE